jgi:predicted enzyme related to lactoylglutathione lyase
MSAGMQTILIPVKDLDAAKALYIAVLGEQPIADSAYYVGFKVAGQDIGLVPNGDKQGMTGPTPYLHVDDIKATLQAALDNGAKVVQDVRDVAAGRLVVTVKDAEGNIFGLLQDPK